MNILNLHYCPLVKSIFAVFFFSRVPLNTGLIVGPLSACLMSIACNFWSHYFTSIFIEKIYYLNICANKTLKNILIHSTFINQGPPLQNIVKEAFSQRFFTSFSTSKIKRADFLLFCCKNVSSFCVFFSQKRLYFRAQYIWKSNFLLK